MLLKTVLSNYPVKEDSLIEMLLEYQAIKRDHYVTDEEIEIIANHFQISESKVCSVISFYTLFSNKPKGKYIIQICKNVPCYVNDGTNVLKTLEKLLGIKVGETTPNQKFTLEYASCLGCCDRAPAMRIDGKTFTNLTTNNVKTIISEFSGAEND